MMLRYESVFSLLESQNANDAVSRSLGISHFDDFGLYTAITEEPLVLIRVASSFLKNRNKCARFYPFTFYTSVKMFLGS